MKILISSDTHRKHENLLKVLERECPVDLLIHLGDAEGYEDYIAEQAGCPVEVVAGNNDFFSSLPREKELQIGKYKVLITCLLYTSPSPRDAHESRMPSSA